MDQKTVRLDVSIVSLSRFGQNRADFREIISLIKRVVFYLMVLLLLSLPSLSFAMSGPTKAPDAASFGGDDNLTGSQDLKSERHSLTLGAGKHWGIDLDVNRPLARDSGWEDVQAGAYLKLTPNFQVKGTVGLGDHATQLQKPIFQNVTPQDTGPRVHLETNFVF